MKHKFERYCKDYENIENYEKALADNFKCWHCHHRLETHTSDGIRREVDILAAELKALNMYYNRPADELVFMTTKEHRQLHKKGKQGYWKGKTGPNKCKKLSEETKNKLSEAHKGRHHSEETKNKISETLKGSRWFNNGKICIKAKECPQGFIPGRL